MANTKGNTLQNSALNWFKGTTYPATQANTWCALFTVAPTNAGGGTEVSGTGYARIAVPQASWGAPSGNSPASMTNSAIIDFGVAGGSWGTVVAFAQMDAVTSGNLLYWANLGVSQAVANGNDVQFAIGALALTED